MNLFTKKTQECASQVGCTRLTKASMTTDTMCLLLTGPTKDTVIICIPAMTHLYVLQLCIVVALYVHSLV